MAKEFIQRSALLYWQKGWQPIPLNRGTKAPLNYDWTRAKFATEQEVLAAFDGEYNIGCLLGSNSGGFVDVDLDRPEAVLLAPNFLHDTGIKWGRVSKPMSHWGYRLVGEQARRVTYYDIPFDGSDPKPLLEIRADGCQTMMPGSIHPEGETIQWYVFEMLADIVWSELTRTTQILAAATLLAKHWNEFGGRHFLALQLAGALARSGWSEIQTDYFITHIAVAARDPEVKDRRLAVRDTYVNLEQGDNVTGWPTLRETCGEEFVRRLITWLGFEQETRFPLNDMGNAQRFLKFFGNDNKFCPQLDKWLTWNGTHWNEAEKAMVLSRTIEVQKVILREALEESDPQRAQGIAKWALNTGQAPRLLSIATIAQGLPSFWVNANQVDRDPWKLCVQNGTIDLRTGGLERPHNRADFITRVSNTYYEPGADAPRFYAFINRIMDNNKPLIRFLQKLLGYCLTGITDEQIFPIFYGTGANGKSTLLEIVRWTIGNYCANADPATFLQQNTDKIRTDLARLRGARLITASEISQNRRLDTAIVKAVTGGDPITARHLFHEEFEYTPTYKVIMGTNYKPVIRGDDEGMWRRLRLVPFTIRIPDEEQDKQLKFKIRDHELPGVLSWLVDGCLAWQREGLGDPPEVVTATTHYREDSDVIRQFLNDAVSFEDPEAKTTSRSLYSAYQSWCKSNGERYASMAVFRDKLEGFGHVVKRAAGGWTWEGLQLLIPVMEESDPTDKNPFSTRPVEA